MEQIYILMLLALVILAVIDLSVGVANDAVNFLNSAIGSKAVSFKTIMIVASLGVIVGAFFSGGMMEIARSGIFVPGQFSFNDVMIIFMAVMITDILLLDVFNSLGLPTSTTVSVIFGLLGASVFLAICRIVFIEADISTLVGYINTEKASEIVYSILLSVLLSFTIGAFVQYISRIIFTFQIERRMRYAGAIFGGCAITAITFFIIFKGLKDASFVDKDMKIWLTTHQLTIIGINLIFWTMISQLIMFIFRVSIFRVIIVIGTFALALAFAGNDLVNFIGVPIAAWQSYGIFTSSGGNPEMMMGQLASEEITAPFYLLMIAGIIMIFTLWTSKKAKSVIETEMNLTRQGDGVDKFTANNLSRILVRGIMYIGVGVNYFLPKALQLRIDKQFEKLEVKGKRTEEPAFDMVRASVNLMVASILISIGTSMQLPLSTTYVTFMVAMGTSFADRAWDRESAVYRVAGVFNVIGGWFVTALIAFLLSGLIACILHFGKVVGLVAMLILVAVLLYKSARIHAKKIKEKEEQRVKLKKSDIVTIHEIIKESSDQISTVIGSINKEYSGLINNLSLQDLTKLKENKKAIKKLEKEVDELKSNVYYFIKNLDETSVEGSKFYIMILGYLQDMVQSMTYITQNSYSHVNNNHKKLKFNQVRDLKKIDNELSSLFNNVEETFEKQSFRKIDEVLLQKGILFENISQLIQKQITRIRTTETSPKNSKLYFGILLETNDLVKGTMNLLELFKEFNLLANKKKR